MGSYYKSSKTDTSSIKTQDSKDKDYVYKKYQKYKDTSNVQSKELNNYKKVSYCNIFICLKVSVN